MTEAKEKEKGERKKTGGLGKVILDTSCLQASGGGGGGCPVEKVLYVIFLVTGCSLDLSSSILCDSRLLQVFYTQLMWQTETSSER